MQSIVMNHHKFIAEKSGLKKPASCEAGSFSYPLAIGLSARMVSGWMRIRCFLVNPGWFLVYSGL